MNYKEPTQAQRSKILAAANEKETLCQEKERREITKVSSPTWWRWLHQGKSLPTKIKLSSNRSAWRKSSLLWFIHLLEAQAS
ncbi:MAG: putative DNA-binding transcriptional regulator AlpA [Sediminicola sp.]|jgi:predicted DNA-binding transcriptional regulator AlpA